MFTFITQGGQLCNMSVFKPESQHSLCEKGSWSPGRLIPNANSTFYQQQLECQTSQPLKVIYQKKRKDIQPYAEETNNEYKGQTIILKK